MCPGPATYCCCSLFPAGFGHSYSYPWFTNKKLRLSECKPLPQGHSQRVSEAGSEARPLVLKPMLFLLHSFRIGGMQHGNPKSLPQGSGRSQQRPTFRAVSRKPPRLRSRSEAPNPSTLLEPSGPLLTQALPLHLTSRRFLSRLYLHSCAALHAGSPALCPFPSLPFPHLEGPHPLLYLAGACPASRLRPHLGPSVPRTFAVVAAHTMPASCALNFHLRLVPHLHLSGGFLGPTGLGPGPSAEG